MSQIVSGKSSDVGLDRPPGEIGPALSISLSQKPKSTVAWTLLVDVITYEGRFRLGRVLTLPPSLTGIASSIVAIAWCPGAIGWSVNASAAGAGDRADLNLATSQCCPGTRAPGVVAVNARSEGRFVRQVISSLVLIPANVSTPVLADNVDRIRFTVRPATGIVDMHFGPPGVGVTGFTLDDRLYYEGTHGRAMSAYSFGGGNLNVMEEVG